MQNKKDNEKLQTLINQLLRLFHNEKEIKQLKKEISEYINYYNYERIKLNLNGMSPVQYRAHHNNN